MRSSVDSDAPAACLKRAASSGCASRTSRIALSPHTGTSPDVSKLSLARSPSSRQIASASEYLLASKAIVGLPSTSIVNIESENLSFISLRLQPQLCKTFAQPTPPEDPTEPASARGVQSGLSALFYYRLFRGCERTFGPSLCGVVTTYALEN